MKVKAGGKEDEWSWPSDELRQCGTKVHTASCSEVDSEEKDGLEVKISFQPAQTAIASGWQKDSGSICADHGTYN